MQESSEPALNQWAIIMLGSFDTKGADFTYLLECLKDHAVDVIYIR